MGSQTASGPLSMAWLRLPERIDDVATDAVMRRHGDAEIGNGDDGG